MSLQEEFAQRFSGLRLAYSVFTPTKEKREDGKAKGKNITISKTRTKEEFLELWQSHLDGTQSIGIVPIDEDSCCVWGAIDVDEYPLDLKRLAKKIKKFSLPLVVCRSKSGNSLTPREFLDYVDTIVLTEEELEKLDPAPVLENIEWLSSSPPCLEHLVAQGFPKGMRNSGLFNVGVFLRKKFPDDWERRLEEVNHQHMQPTLSSQEVLGVVKQLKKKDYFYRCNDQPIASHCNSPLCRTRKYGVGASGGAPLFSNLSKQNSDPPIWFLDVEGGRLELETEELLNQTRFQRKCMSVLPESGMNYFSGSLGRTRGEHTSG